jgi:hypothetical protein
MNIRDRYFVRRWLVLVLLCALGAATTAPTFATGLHTTLDVVPFSPTLTLSDSSNVHIGLVEVDFAITEAQPTSVTKTVVTVQTPTNTPVIVAGTLPNGATLMLPSNCTGAPTGSVFTTPVRCSLINFGNQTAVSPILIECQTPSDCASASNIAPPCFLPFTATAASSQDSSGDIVQITAVQNLQLFAPNSSK